MALELTKDVTTVALKESDTTPMTVLFEECSGEGNELAFPSMSSCVAVICLLDGGSLVGIHKTTSQASTNKYWEAAIAVINKRKILRIYVVGWITTETGETAHSPKEIVSFLMPDDNENEEKVQLFVSDYGEIKKVSEEKEKSAITNRKREEVGGGTLCTFARLNADMSVSIGFRQNQKLIFKRNAKTKRGARFKPIHMDVSVSGSFYATKNAQIQSFLGKSENDDNDYTDLSFSMITPGKLDRRNQKYHHDQGATSNNVRGWRMIHSIMNELRLNDADDEETIWT